MEKLSRNHVGAFHFLPRHVPNHRLLALLYLGRASTVQSQSFVPPSASNVHSPLVMMCVWAWVCGGSGAAAHGRYRHFSLLLPFSYRCCDRFGATATHALRAAFPPYVSCCSFLFSC